MQDINDNTENEMHVLYIVYTMYLEVNHDSLEFDHSK